MNEPALVEYSEVPENVVRQIRRETRQELINAIVKEIRKLNVKLDSPDVDHGFRYGLIRALTTAEETSFAQLARRYKIPLLKSELKEIIND